MGIPVVVGVTGHRALRTQDIPLLREKVKQELENLRASCPHSDIIMLNSVASGGDSLCAECALELGITLICPLPFPAEEYRKDFSAEDGAVYERLLERADSVFVVPDTEEVPSQSESLENASADAYRDFRYRQTGIYIATHSHVLLALWDGGPPEKGGCGTAEAVDFALRGSYRPASGPAFYHGGTMVIHINAPREGAEGTAGERHICGTEQFPGEIVEKTETFNRLASGKQEPGYPLLPEDAAADTMLRRLEDLYQGAEALSMKAAVTFRRVVASLAVSGTVLTLAFLLYDEAELCWMILLCGAMLVCAWASLRHARKSECHSRYIEYRALAESLRVQAFLRYAGSARQVPELFTWTQLLENGWIAAAVSAVVIGDGPPEEHDISLCWVEDQRAYHEKAAVKKGEMLKRNDWIVKTAAICSIVFFLIVLAFELTAGDLSLIPGVISVDLNLYRAIFKIVLGSFSAATLFASGYYGKLSLSRQVSDHRKMERFYREIGEQLSRWGQSEELLDRLAREELTENGNWYSYQQDNTPDISI